jgi:cell division protein FtsW (lipid II flippase)
LKKRGVLNGDIIIVSRLRAVSLIAIAFFCALLVMYRFDVGMAVTVFATAAVFAAFASIKPAEIIAAACPEHFRRRRQLAWKGWRIASTLGNRAV